MLGFELVNDGTNLCHRLSFGTTELLSLAPFRQLLKLIGYRPELRRKPLLHERFDRRIDILLLERLPLLAIFGSVLKLPCRLRIPITEYRFDVAAYLFGETD